MTNAIFLKLKIPLLFAHRDGAVILSNLFHKTLCQALRDKGLLVQDSPCIQNGFHAKDAANVSCVGTVSLGLFQVTDMKVGLETIRAELASLEALPFSEIGYCEHGTAIWRGWQPPDAETDFPANVELLKTWCDQMRKQNPQQ
jgi:hypothetical protein